MNKKISIIIPVYNVENYIERCLESILDNTYKNIEIVLVNDGSIDRSQKIINKYKKKYPETIISEEQENKGPAEARNLGMKIASGDYYMFIDSDDYIEKDYIFNYAKQLEEDDYDLVIGGYFKTSEKKILYSVTLDEGEPWSEYRVMGPYTRLYKATFLKKNNIKFEKINIGEDIYFNFQANNLAKKIKIIKYVGYHWYLNTESVSNTMHKDIKSIEVDKMLNLSYDCLKNKNAINDNNRYLIEMFYYNFIIWVLQYSTKKTKFRDMSKEYDKLFEWLEQRFPEYKKNKLIGFGKPKGERKNVQIMFWGFMMAHKLHFGKIVVFIFSRLR